MVEGGRLNILVLNQISAKGLKRLPSERYVVGKDVTVPDAVLLRSADMHAMHIPDSVKAIGRAGAGTNNIPVPAMSARGVPVFNAPGANANAVKELVLAGMLLAARNLPAALLFVATLDPKTARIVLELSAMIISAEKMTTMMVTHNMEVALRYGNRLIMMHQGRIIVDMNHAQRQNLKVNDLVIAFERASGEYFADDSILLSTAAPDE